MVSLLICICPTKHYWCIHFVDYRLEHEWEKEKVKIQSAGNQNGTHAFLYLNICWWTDAPSLVSQHGLVHGLISGVYNRLNRVLRLITPADQDAGSVWENAPLGRYTSVVFGRASLDRDGRASGGDHAPAQKALVGRFPTLAPRRLS